MAKVIAVAISGAMSGDDWTDMVNDHLRNFALENGFPHVPQLQWLDLEDENDPRSLHQYSLELLPKLRQ